MIKQINQQGHRIHVLVQEFSKQQSSALESVGQCRLFHIRDGKVLTMKARQGNDVLVEFTILLSSPTKSYKKK